MKIQSLASILCIFTLIPCTLLVAQNTKEDRSAPSLRVLEIDDTFKIKRVGRPELSPDGKWFVNGYKKNKKGTKNYYAVYRRSDGAYRRSDGIDKGSYGGDIRIDPAPRWNRTNDAILVPGISKDKTRQIFMIRITNQ